MKIILVLFLAFSSWAFGDAPDVGLPEKDVELIKSADFIAVSGTNDSGGVENFTIHNYKAIAQFVGLLTADRYTAVPKSLKPQFKSLSSYKVSFSAKGAPVLEIQIMAESILDIPEETDFYMQSERHSDNLMAPLLRLR